MPWKKRASVNLNLHKSENFPTFVQNKILTFFFLLSRLFKNLFLRTIYDTVRRLVKRRGRPHKADSWFCTLADDSGATDWNRCKKSPKPMSLWESVKLIFSLLMLLYHKVRHKNGKWASICKGHGLIHTCKIFSISNSAAREQVYISYLGKTSKDFGLFVTLSI